MKKYILIFAVSSCFGISRTVAQSQVTTGQNQSAVVAPDSLRGSGNSQGTISKAGKGQQSVYTPPANSPAPTSGTPASPAKGQPAVIEPKKQD